MSRQAWAGLIVAASVLAACGQDGSGGKPGAAAGAGGGAGPGGPGAMPPAEVGVVVAQPSSVSVSRELPGRTSAYLIAEVRPQIGGILQKRLFEEGAMVKAGQPLYEVADSPYKAAVDSAVANVKKAQTTYEANRVKARRLTQLAEINAVSRQSADDANAAVQQSLAEVGVAKAALETAKVNLGYTRITAPIAGRVSTSAFTVGALLTAGQPNALTTVQQLDPIYVDITQSSNELLQLQRDLASGKIKSAGDGKAEVKLVLPDGTAYGQPGKLTFSGATVDPTTGSVTMRALFPNPDNTLLPGMFTRAILEEGVRPNTILVPQRAVQRDPTGGANVLVVGADNKVAPRPVKVDRSVGDQYLIGEGLKAGDQVIVDGLQKAKPGATVVPKPLQAAAGAAPAGSAAAGAPAAGGSQPAAGPGSQPAAQKAAQ